MTAIPNTFSGMKGVIKVPSQYVTVPVGSRQFIVHSVEDVSDEETSDKRPARKRQKLDHLSPEEKLQRRKLKNRVAAQTARDRKKARMDDLEVTVTQFEKEIHTLKTENELLWKLNANLKTENETLKLELEKTKMLSSVKEEPRTLVPAAAELKAEKPFDPAAIIRAPQLREQGSRPAAAAAPQEVSRRLRAFTNLLSYLVLVLLSGSTAAIPASTSVTTTTSSTPPRTSSQTGLRIGSKSLPSLRPFCPQMRSLERRERLARVFKPKLARILTPSQKKKK